MNAFTQCVYSIYSYRYDRERSLRLSIKAQKEYKTKVYFYDELKVYLKKKNLLFIGLLKGIKKKRLI